MTTPDTERLERLEARLDDLALWVRTQAEHQRAQIATLHERLDTLRGAVTLQGDSLTDVRRALEQLRAELLQQPCSLCLRGEGCDSCFTSNDGPRLA